MTDFPQSVGDDGWLGLDIQCLLGDFAEFPGD